MTQEIEDYNPKCSKTSLVEKPIQKNKFFNGTRKNGSAQALILALTQPATFTCLKVSENLGVWALEMAY